MNSKASFLGIQLFVFAIIILFLNDFYFKSTFPGIITGKLSDLVGLYSFAWFLSSVFSRLRLLVHFLVAAFFIYWKTPFSTSFINWFSFYFYPIDRVVDYSDYLTLPVLFLSWRFSPGNLLVFSKSYLRNSLLLFSCFTFAATTIRPDSVKLEHPQYLLLNNRQCCELKFNNIVSCHVDTFCLLKIEEISSYSDYLYEDDFDKKSGIIQLGKSKICQYPDTGEFVNKNINDLLFKDSVRLKFKTNDSLIDFGFYNGRLNGYYEIYIKGNLQCSGYYKFGVPDSIWKYYNEQGELIKESIYLDGERTKENFYEKSKLSEVRNIQSRQDVKNNYWMVLIITIIMFLVILFVQYYKFKHQRMPVNIWSRIIIMIIMMAVSLTVDTIAIQILNLDSYGYPFQIMFFSFISLPILFLLSFFIPFENYLDVIIYGILYGLLLLSLSEFIYIGRITVMPELEECFYYLL